MKKIAIAMALLMMIMSLVGCDSKNDKSKTEETQKISEENKGSKDGELKPVTLTMFLHDNEAYEYYTQTNSISEAYKKVAPHVTVQIEKAKDSGQLEETLKIRYSANELPDIMFIKPYMLADFNEGLADLSDTNATATNLYAKNYGIEGKVAGIPQTVLYEFIYYRKSVFEELGLNIPTTWDEFITTAETIKNNSEYIPIALGAKDAWTDYPFNEFMPCLVAGRGDYWNVMATQDEPFTAGEPFYDSYKKIKKLYDADVFGLDPLGIGWDQAQALFYAKEAAMVAAGQWFISNYASSDADPEDLGMFMLPVRDSKDEPLTASIMGDLFLATPKDGKNLDESKAFIDWYFSSDYYIAYSSAVGANVTTKDADVDLPYIEEMTEALNREKLTYVLYDGGNTEFNNIVNAISFDVKRMGQEMLAGEDFDKMMSELNEDWKKARNK
ncbi:ABC transporter substrate-binding protein [Vallitalea maricola]|uniref:Uncharacterized protein n=1 Tax=Vallitalea maricola TaxID=3074433 RepID=A0ACB5UJS8_9FIRM|nr:hypothetical protein AN2V17_23550 [Vallitalea sp. AN17-2]